MKKLISTTVALAITLSLSGTALAQRIGWTPVTPGNMQWSNAPGSGRTTYQQIGPTTFGSDGSAERAQEGVTYQRSGNVVTFPNGNRGVINGDNYTEYDRSGEAVRSCTRVSGISTCTSY